jgi:hypothetical protein
MREALDPRVSLEVALVRIARPDTDTSPAALLERIERLERGGGGGGGGGGAPAPAPVETTAPAAPAGAAAARKALGAVKKSRPRAEAAPAPAAPEPDRVPTAVTDARIPSRDELTTAWADTIIPNLLAKTRAIYAAGRWVDGQGDVPSFALPNEVHRGRAEKHRADVEEKLAVHFGGPIPLTLVVDEGQVTAHPAEPQGHDEPLDITELSDAPPGLTSPEDRLKQAFPGAEEVV